MSTPGSKQQYEAPVLVDSPAALAAMVEQLGRRSAFALDTESNSFYVYYPKVCLIQITTFADAHKPDPADVVDFLVDPLALDSLAPLGELTARPDMEVVMHAAENDILQLRRDFGFRFARVFDTQLAARILGWARVGLGAILEEQFGVVSDKRMQRTDWAERPLSPSQIAYAQMDTHYLLVLRDQLRAELAAAERLEEAEDALEQLAAFDTVERSPNQRSFWQMKVTHNVDLHNTGVLEALWGWREQEAQRTNRPPFKIMGDETLAALATARPRTLEQLRGTPGLSSQQIGRYGNTLLEVVREGGRRPLPALPKPTLRPELMLSPRDQNSFERLRRWRTDTARARGVAPEIVFNNDTLLEIVQSHPASEEALQALPGVGRWKAATYGPALLALLDGSGQ